MLPEVALMLSAGKVGLRWNDLHKLVQSVGSATEYA